MDQICLRNLKVKARIGVHERERRKPQALILELKLHTSLKKAGRSDKLTDTIDYAALIDMVRHNAARESFCLIEALAERMAELCLANARVKAVDVTVLKPNTVKNACVGVSIQRSRKSKR